MVIRKNISIQSLILRILIFFLIFPFQMARPYLAADQSRGGSGGSIAPSHLIIDLLISFHPSLSSSSIASVSHWHHPISVQRQLSTILNSALSLSRWIIPCYFRTSPQILTHLLAHFTTLGKIRLYGDGGLHGKQNS